MTLINRRYRILHSIGRGGFGETFLVEDTQMPSGRRCVLKQLKSTATDPQTTQLVQERFAREAAILEFLGEAHPQIPTLYAYFTENDRFYLAQEWIEGQTLTERLQTRGTMSDGEVRQLLVNLLPVLDFIHSQGIVHRDIKPDNIILRDRDGLTVPIDFGAVRETMGTMMSSSGNPTSSIIIGTPGFMSSEQAAGRPIYSSDLYSLGLTAIFLLTGKLPQALSIDPRTGKVLWPSDARIEAGLKQVLDKAIEHHPRDRYATASEMLAALQTPQPIPPQAPQTPVIPSTAATVAVAPGWENRSNTPSTVAATTVAAPPTKKSNKGGLLVGAIIGGVAIGASIAALALRGDSGKDDVSVVPSPTPTVEALPTPTPTPIPTPTPTPEVRSFYFLADSAYADRNNAERRLQALKNQGYTNAGSFWLPDYANLSGKPYTQVYLDRFSNRDDCIDILRTYGRDNADAYCAFASSDPNAPTERITTRDVVAQTPQVPDNRPSPVNATRDYYAAIDRGDIILGWNTLSRALQDDSNLHPNGFRDYEAWWNQVRDVRVEDLQLFDVAEEESHVDVKLLYFMKSGETSRDALRIKWIWDRYNNRWVYDDATYLN